VRKYPIRNFLADRLAPEQVYRFFEERQDFSEVERIIPPPRPEDARLAPHALARARTALKKLGKRGLPGPVPPGFSPPAVLSDMAAAYDQDLHERVRRIAWYLSSYLFTHDDPASPFLSKDRREARHADTIRAHDGPILFVPNYNSHLDSVMIAVYFDALGLCLPFSALGDLLMPSAAVEQEMKRLRVIKITKSHLWAPHYPAYERILSEYMKALFEGGARVVVHSEASRYTTRSIDGTMRATIPPWIISALLSSERDVLVVPLTLSLSRVPEDRALTYHKPLAGLISRNDLSADVPITRYLRFGRGWWGRLFSAVLDGMPGVYGTAYLTLGEPFLKGDMIREAPAGRDPADTIARRAMEETARNKKVLPTHLVAGTLMSRERLTKRELHPAAAEELERLIAFHRERYGSAPDLDDSFSGGIGRAVEAGLLPMTERRIVKKGLMLPRRFYVSNRVLGRFYANQLDHRIYPQWSGHNLTVVNAGAFGYTLTTHLGRKFDADPAYADWSLVLFDARRDIVQAIAEHRSHPDFFPGSVLPKVVHVESDLGAGIGRAEIVVVATPSDHFRETACAILDAHPDPFVLVIATKGFEAETSLLPVEAAWEEMDRRGRSSVQIAVISGANLAGEIMEERLTATQLAVENNDLRARLIDIFSTDDFYVYPSSDLLGTQLAGAMKNVYAIAYGIADGSKDASVNFTATLVTRISAEIKTLALAMGADPETFDTEGQAWMADFLATARGGRNSEFGKALVRWPVPIALRFFKDAKKNVEGYAATKAAMELAQRYRVELPIVEALYDILYEMGEANPRRFIRRPDNR
jgi:glycerol-3-phosphate dehydrogenase (NAD(P)+)